MKWLRLELLLHSPYCKVLALNGTLRCRYLRSECEDQAALKNVASWKTEDIILGRDEETLWAIAEIHRRTEAGGYGEKSYIHLSFLSGNNGFSVNCLNFLI